MAAQAAIAAWRSDGTASNVGVDAWRSRINLWWSYYSNETFSNLAAWQSYRQNYTLYRNIRSIYNPTRRLVNFYVAQTYPGMLSDDGSKLPDGVALAIPLSDDTPENLKLAIAEFWRMSNWQLGNKLMVRYGAATGSCLVELVDNVERGKVTTAVRWPGLLASKAKDEGPSLILDDVGNVKFYALEYQTTDDKGDTYTYRKEVSQEAITTYRDDSVVAQIPNVYGFVPAVWCKHIDEGWGIGGFEGEQNFGTPAIHGSLGKIDELNGLVSHVHDHVDRVIESPGILASDGKVGRIQDQASAIKGVTADEYSALDAARDKPTRTLILKGPKDTNWIPMVGNLDPEKTILHTDRLLSEIEHDHPELSMYQELRKMSQVTGPGAARMMGDVYSRVLEVASNYDQQSIKLFQMACAIGGMRFKEGKLGWKERTEQREKFAPFDLESYQKGQLNFSIMPRPLIPLTEADSIELTGKRLDNAKKAKDILSEVRVLDIAGVPEDEQASEITLLTKEREAKAALTPKVAVPGNVNPAV